MAISLEKLITKVEEKRMEGGKLHKFNQSVNWRDFTLGYIGAACACADTYLNHDPNYSGFPYGAATFIPAFWNFKHALELGIKFLFPSTKDKCWGHDLTDNLERYEEERNLSDEKCKELRAMCEKYGKLEPLQKLKNVKGRNFIPPDDFENQFFHYPEGNKSHEMIYDTNDYFAYYSLIISQPDDNKKTMRELMEELKEDAYSFAQILGKHMN